MRVCSVKMFFFFLAKCRPYMKIWGVLTKKGGLWMTGDKNYGTVSKEWGHLVKAPHRIGGQKEYTWCRPWYLSALGVDIGPTFEECFNTLHLRSVSTHGVFGWQMIKITGLSVKNEVLGWKFPTEQGVKWKEYIWCRPWWCPRGRYLMTNVFQKFK